MRVKILLDAAKGMAYLHQRGTTFLHQTGSCLNYANNLPGILHSNLKASKLLLAAGWETTKISDTVILDASQPQVRTATWPQKTPHRPVLRQLLVSSHSIGLILPSPGIIIFVFIFRITPIHRVYPRDLYISAAGRPSCRLRARR